MSVLLQNISMECLKTSTKKPYYENGLVLHDFDVLKRPLKTIMSYD